MLHSLVENMVKKNRSRFSIAVILDWHKNCLIQVAIINHYKAKNNYEDW